MAALSKPCPRLPQACPDHLGTNPRRYCTPADPPDGEGMITSGKTPTPAHEQHGTTTPQAPVATDDRLLTAAEVAEHLRITTKTLANWSSAGIAPPSIRLPSRSRRYRASDLATWLSTAEAA